MWLYLVGAVLLHLVLLSALAAHYQVNGSVSVAMGTYQLLFSW
jgi:hypothetical protein